MEKENVDDNDILLERNSVSGFLYVTIDKELLYFKEFKDRIKVEIVFDRSVHTGKNDNPQNWKVKSETVPLASNACENEEDSSLDNYHNNDLDEETVLPVDGPKQIDIECGENGKPSKKRKIETDHIGSSKDNPKLKITSYSNQDARLKENCEKRNHIQKINSSGTDDTEKNERYFRKRIGGKTVNHNLKKRDDLSCRHCSKKYKSKREFKAHYLVETDNHTCEVCDTVFKYKAHLVVHRKLVHNLETSIHSDDNPKRHTEICNGNLPQSCSTETSDKGVKSYKCEICNIGMCKLSILQKHMLKHTGEFLYKCCICTTQLNYIDTLKKHLASHSNGKYLELINKGERRKSEPGKMFCPYCSKKFESQREFKSHYESETKNHPCKKCNKLLKYNAHLIVHTSLVHQEEASSSAYDNLSLVTNVTTATNSDGKVDTKSPVCRVEISDDGVKSYKCNICEFGTATLKNLNNHMMRHTGETTYKCCVCELQNGFNHKGSLNKHLAQHGKYLGTQQDISCPHCSKIFNGDQELRSHLEVETTDHPCQKCLKIFRYKAHLVVHYNIVHNIEIPDNSVEISVVPLLNNKSCSIPDNSAGISAISLLNKKPCSIETSDNGLNIYKCNICDLQLATLRTLNTHMMKHTNEFLYQCCICDFQNCNVATLKRHMDSHKFSRLVKCKLCKLHFSDRAELGAHQQTHTYQCSLCGQSFPNRSTRTFHYKTAHKTDILKCHICGRLHSCKKALELHIKYHLQSPRSQCPICGVFVNQLRKHTVKHHQPASKSNDALFVCDKCPKQFSTKAALNKHLPGHSEYGGRPVSCPQCHKNFATVGTLTKHLKIHSEGKPFVCEICGKSCNRKENLKTHMRVHTKPEVVHCNCNHCGAEFTCNRDLEKHINTVHKEDMVEAYEDQYLQNNGNFLM